ncbi:MAG: hypothetical protein M1835_001193, partial [Candelina submexicana]
MATNAHDRRASQQSAKSSASAFSSRVTSKVKRLVQKFEDLDKNHGRETKRFKLPEKDSRSRFWSTPGTTQRYKHSRINRKSESYRPISAIYLGKHYWGIPNQDGPADTVPPEPTKSNGAPVTTSPATTYTLRTARKNTRKTTPIHETDEDHSNPHPEENVVKRRATIFSRLASHRKKCSQQEPYQNASFGDSSLINVGSPEDHALSSSAKRSAAARRSTSIRTGVKAIISIFNRRRGQDTTPPGNQLRATPGDVDEESVKKVSPDTVDNYRGVDFKRLESTSKKTRQSSSGFDYPSGILPPGFFDSRCSSIDIAAGIHSGQSSSKPLERKWILNPLYVQQSQRKHKSENSTAQQISSQNPTNAAKSGGLYLQNLSASAISLNFRDIEKALAQRSSPSHRSIRDETKLSRSHNPSSAGNTGEKARA